MAKQPYMAITALNSEHIVVQSGENHPLVLEGLIAHSGGVISGWLCDNECKFYVEMCRNVIGSGGTLDRVTWVSNLVEPASYCLQITMSTFLYVFILFIVLIGSCAYIFYRHWHMWTSLNLTATVVIIFARPTGLAYQSFVSNLPTD